jgi:hypothetical protein
MLVKILSSLARRQAAEWANRDRGEGTEEGSTAAMARAGNQVGSF